MVGISWRQLLKTTKEFLEIIDKARKRPVELPAEGIFKDQDAKNLSDAVNIRGHYSQSRER